MRIEIVHYQMNNPVPATFFDRVFVSFPFHSDSFGLWAGGSVQFLTTTGSLHTPLSVWTWVYHYFFVLTRIHVVVEAHKKFRVNVKVWKNKNKSWGTSTKILIQCDDSRLYQFYFKAFFWSIDCRSMEVYCFVNIKVLNNSNALLVALSMFAFMHIVEKSDQQS